MAIKPILFNTDMVKAILEGRKTQTRRVVKFTDCEVYDAACMNGMWNEQFDPEIPPHALVEWFVRNKARKPYALGDILWIRETWSTHYDGIHDELQFCYKADGIDLKSECLPGENNRWYPSIHMPKEAARIFLIVKRVRTERLQDISFENCKAEGIWDDYNTPSHICHENLQRVAYPVVFKELWNRTIKKSDLPKYGWDANPWVRVIEFERCEKPEGFPDYVQEVKPQ